MKAQRGRGRTLWAFGPLRPQTGRTARHGKATNQRVGRVAARLPRVIAPLLVVLVVAATVARVVGPCSGRSPATPPPATPSNSKSVRPTEASGIAPIRLSGA